MNTGTTDLTTGIETFETRAPGKIGDDPTHHIVGRRRDRNLILSRIDAAGQANVVNARKPAGKTAPDFSRIKKYRTARLLFAENFAGHDVAWCQLG